MNTRQTGGADPDSPARASRRSRRRTRWPILIIGFALILGIVALRVVDPAPVVAVRHSYFDYLQRLKPRQFADLPVRVVDIDEASLATIGQWPWPRSTLARLTDNLFKMGAAAVAFDALFAEPDRYSPSQLMKNPAYRAAIPEGTPLAALDYDQLFAEAIKDQPVVLGVSDRTGDGTSKVQGKAGFVQIGDNPAAGLPMLPALTGLAPYLEPAAEGIGGVNVAPNSGGGPVERVPLVWNTPNGLLPSLSLEALRLALGESTITVIGTPGLSESVQAVRVGSYTIPTDNSGEILVKYRRDDPRLYVSARDVLNDADLARLQPKIQGQIVLIGTSAAGLLDLHTTALGEQVPGVSIHAQILEQILQGTFLTRTDTTAGLELLSFIVLGLIVTGVMSISGPELSIAAGAVAGGVMLAVSWYAFSTHGLLFDATMPLFGGALNFAVLVGYQFIIADRDKRRVRRSFAHYVAPEVLNRIEESGHHLTLGGEVRDLTIMFSDIRNFTPLSETMTAEELVSVLNDLFTRLSGEILSEEGTIDKFIGDAVMAFWNAPLPVPEHPRRAALAGLRMRRALQSFNKTPLMDGRKPIRMAIGIATGEACVGNIGSTQRFNYTAIGDTVNTASRLETICRHVGYDIVVSDSVAETDLATMPAGYVSLKGKSHRISSHIVVGDAALARDPAFQELLSMHKKLLGLLHGDDAEAGCAELFAVCASLGQMVEPGLEEFYSQLMSRRDDFAA